MIKEELTKSGVYKDIVRLVKGIINAKLRSLNVEPYLTDQNTISMVIDPDNMQYQAALFLVNLENGTLSKSLSNFKVFYRYIKYITDALLIQYSMSLASNKKPSVLMRDIRIYLILEDILDFILNSDKEEWELNKEWLSDKEPTFVEGV